MSDKDSILYGPGYDTPEDAAAGAELAATFFPNAQKQEYMTLIVKDPQTGKYRRQAFQTEGSGTSSSWTGRPGGKLEGIFHNHPATKAGDRYRNTDLSAPDINASESMNVPSYVGGMNYAAKGTTPTATGSMYTPSGNKLKVPQGRTAPGQSYLAQYPIEEAKQRIMMRIAQGNLPQDIKNRILNSMQASASVWSKP